MQHICRPPLRTLRHRQHFQSRSLLLRSLKMIETLTSQSAGIAATKPRSMSAAASASQHGTWKIRKVTSFPQKWEYTPADFTRGDENSVSSLLRYLTMGLIVGYGILYDREVCDSYR